MPQRDRPFISICIPAYNSGTKLETLLDSVRIQTFQNYEIVVTDDSPNEAVRRIIETKYTDLNIRYFQNTPSLGTPANWNRAVAESKGEWIKIMHHDDWFVDKESLNTFVTNCTDAHDAKLLFCAFQNVNTDKNTISVRRCSALDIFLLRRNPRNLFKNFIGNPSCTLLSSQLMPFKFDERVKWLIDFDFYTWYFRRETKFTYIDKPLIAFRIHSGQVTAQSISNPAVEIPESAILFEKYGIDILKNIFVYDFFWRMFRNLSLKSVPEAESFLKNHTLYPQVKRMITFQCRVSRKVLTTGIFSKVLMFLSYLSNKFRHENKS